MARLNARCLLILLSFTGLCLLTPAEAAVTGASLSCERIFDPKLQGAHLTIQSQARGSGSYSARVTVLDDTGRLVQILQQQSRNTGSSYRDFWSGHDSSGLFVRPGQYTIRFEADNRVAEQTVNVVRLGLLAMRFNDAKDNQARVRLAYHRPDPQVAGNPFPLDSAGLPWVLEASTVDAYCLDDAQGSPLPVPAKWTDVNAPPRNSRGQVLTRGRSLPVAYPHSSQPNVTVLLGSSAAHQGRKVDCGYPVDQVSIGLIIGQSGIANLRPGQSLSLDLPQLPEGIGKDSMDLEFRFVYNTGQGWRYVPGWVKTQHDCYRTVTKPQTDDGLAWVAALDLASRRGGETVKTQSQVCAKMVELVNRDLFLHYDVVSGAPAYADAPWGLENPLVSLGAFLENQRFGRTINCLDCASIVGSLARHMGSPNYVAIMGWDFDLYWIRGLGGTRFINDLFTYHGFSYHAIASIDQGRTIHDACLSIDADEHPDRAPHTDKLPSFMNYYDYRRQLSPERPIIQALGAARQR